MSKKPKSIDSKKTTPILRSGSSLVKVQIGPPPERAKKKDKKSKLRTSPGETLIYTDEEVVFSIQKPTVGNLDVTVQAFLANVNSSTYLNLSLPMASPATAFFSVPVSSGYFDGNDTITLEDEWTTVPFELNGETFEEEEVGNILLLILIRGTEGTAPNQTVYQAGVIYSVVSPYSLSRKKAKGKAKAKKKKKA